MSSINIKPTHVHPEILPTATPPPEYAAEHEHSSHLCCEHVFENKFRLYGLQNARREAVSDIFCPDVRRSPLSHDSSIRHLDVIMCWKGLSLKQAEEIFAWERIFQEALEALVSDDVHEAVLTQLHTDKGTSELTQDIGIVLEDLVRTMIQIHFSLKPDIERERTWSAVDGDLPSFVYNFIRTRDCFIDTFPQLSVRVYLTFSLPARLMFAEVVWQPPAIDFSDLPGDPNYQTTINPAYQSPKCGNVDGFVAFPDHFRYSVDDNTPSMTTNWSTFVATTEICFPGGVRFQRISRYVIKTGNINHHGCDKKRIRENKINTPIDDKESAYRRNNEPGKCNVKKRTTGASESGTASRVLLADRFRIDELASKRPRLEQQAPTLLRHRREVETELKVWLDTQKHGPRHQSTDSSDEARGRDDRLSPESISTSPKNPLSPESLPSDAAYDPMSDQDVIRRNYDEFSSQTQHLRVTTDEARECAEYENMFLEGNSDCTSMLSGDVSAISLED